MYIIIINIVYYGQLSNIHNNDEPLINTATIKSWTSATHSQCQMQNFFFVLFHIISVGHDYFEGRVSRIVVIVEMLRSQKSEKPHLEHNIC